MGRFGTRWACLAVILAGCGGRIAPWALSGDADASGAADAPESADAAGSADAGPVCQARGIVLAVSTPPTLSLMTFSPDTLAVTTEGTLDTGDLEGFVTALAVERDGGVGIAVGSQGTVGVGFDGGGGVGNAFGVVCWLDAHHGCATSRVSFDYGNLSGLTFAGGADGGPETLYATWIGQVNYSGPAIGSIAVDGGARVTTAGGVPVFHVSPLRLTDAYPLNLTATGDGRLFLRSESTVEGVDPSTGAMTAMGPTFTAPSCPMAFWAGELYFFCPPSGPPADMNTTFVLRYRASDGSTTPVAQFAGVTGAAGVSACAPSAR